MQSWSERSGEDGKGEPGVMICSLSAVFKILLSKLSALRGAYHSFPAF